MRVFISYSHQDARLAEEVARALQDRGFEPSLAQELPPGSKLPEVVERAIAEAQGWLFVIRGDARANERLKKEGHTALRAHWGAEDQKAFVPLLIGDADPPPFLRGLVAVRIPAEVTDYAAQADAIAGRIAYLLTHPAETIDPASREKAKAEQQIWRQTMEKYIESLVSEQRAAESGKPTL